MEKLPAKIKSLTHDGRGVATINGKTTFIEGALRDEIVSYRYLRQHQRYDEARSEKIITPSPYRVEPRCQHFSVCGGCSLQHCDPQEQIQAKEQMLLNQLAHFGGIEPATLLPPLLGPVWGYRRKARLGVKFVPKKQKIIVGFREKNSRYLADIQRCEVLHPKVGYHLEELRFVIDSLQARQHIPQIEVAAGDDETAYVIRHLQALSLEDRELLIQFGKTHKCRIYLQPGGLESIHLLWPEDNTPFMRYALPDHGIEILFYPTDFTQINFDINRRLINVAIELLAPSANDSILDLFCGLGNFTLPLAKYASKVVGVEGNTAMVERAKHNAQHNQINNVDFYTQDLSKTTLSSEWLKQKFSKILLDPARTGALEIIKQLPPLQAKRIVYVSCNPATLARDAGELVKSQGYTLSHAGVIDMFPHTSHVESIAVFEK